MRFRQKSMSWNHSLSKSNILALIPNQKSCFLDWDKVLHSLLKWGLQKSHHLPVGWLSPQEEVRQVTIYEQKAGVGVIATPIHITHSALQLFLLFNDGAISLLSVHSIFIRSPSLVPVED